MKWTDELTLSNKTDRKYCDGCLPVFAIQKGECQGIGLKDLLQTTFLGVPVYERFIFCFNTILSDYAARHGRWRDTVTYEDRLTKQVPI